LSVVSDQPHSARINLNPYPDKHGKLVHTFLYQTNGVFNGQYPHMMKWVNGIPGTKTGWTMRTGVKHHYYLADDKGLGMDLLPGWAGIYRFWSPVAGRIRFTCRLVGDSATEVDFLIKEGARELYAATCAAGDMLTAKLELDIKSRARIDFIVRAAAQSRASVVLRPRIQLIKTPKSLLPQGEG